MVKVKLGDICNPKQWRTLATSELKTNGKYSVYGANGVIGYYDDYNHEKETVLITCRGATCGNVHISKEKSYINGNAMAMDNLNEEICLKEYLYYFLKQYDMKKVISGSAQPQITVQDIKKINIAIVGMDTQIKIIKNLNKIQEIIDIRKKQIGKLDELIKSQFVEMFGNIEKQIELKDYIISLDAGKSLAGDEESINKVLKTGSVSYDHFDEEEIKNLPVNYIPKKEHKVNVGDVIISRMNTTELVGAVGYVWKVKDNVYIPDRLWKANLKNNTNPIFIWQLLIQNDMKEQIHRICSGTSGSMKNISKEKFLKLKVKNVPIELQNQFADFVKRIDKQKLKLQKSLEEMQKLQESLMNKYF